MTNELRCYTFTNFMLSSIQQGIQSGHAAMELVNKYMVSAGWQDGFAETVSRWIEEHKTIVCLNGGNAEDVREWKAFFDAGMQSNDCRFPYAPFFEDEQSLDGALTSVAVILPSRIFEGAAAFRRSKYDATISMTQDHLLDELRIGWTDGATIHSYVYNKWERELLKRLNNAQLAR